MARQSRMTTNGRRVASRAADAAGKKPVNSVAPAITGTETEGEVLSCSAGTWSNTPTYSRIWKRDGAVIDGETGATYTLTSDDVGAAMSASVVATNDGVQGVASAAPTGEIEAA